MRNVCKKGGNQVWLWVCFEEVFLHWRSQIWRPKKKWTKNEGVLPSSSAFNRTTKLAVGFFEWEGGWIATSERLCFSVFLSLLHLHKHSFDLNGMENGEWEIHFRAAKRTWEREKNGKKEEREREREKSERKTENKKGKKSRSSKFSFGESFIPFRWCLKKKFFGKKIFWSQMTNRSFPLRRQMQRFTSFMTRKRFGRNHWNVFQFYDKKKKSHFRTDGIEWTILLLSTKKSLKYLFDEAVFHTQTLIRLDWTALVYDIISIYDIFHEWPFCQNGFKPSKKTDLSPKTSLRWWVEEEEEEQ